MIVKRKCPFCGDNNVDMMYSEKLQAVEFYCMNCTAVTFFERFPFDRVAAEKQYNSCEKLEKGYLQTD